MFAEKDDWMIVYLRILKKLNSLINILIENCLLYAYSTIR